MTSSPSFDLIAIGALVVSLISLVVSIIGGTINYFHTNKMFRMANFPKIVIDVSTHTTELDTIIAVSLQNTHATVSVSNIEVSTRISRIMRFSFFPHKIIQHDTLGLECLKPGQKDTVSTMDINDGISACFSNTIYLKHAKKSPEKTDDGAVTQLKTISTEDYYGVHRGVNLLLQVIIIYTPDLLEGRPQKLVERFSMRPDYDKDDIFRTFKGWRIEAMK